MSASALRLGALALCFHAVTSEAPACGPDEKVATICRGARATKCSEYLTLPGPLDETSCTEGCVCIGSKLHNDKGVCIESIDCPELYQCKNVQNAQPSCGRFCKRRCPGHQREPDQCGGECDEDGCECLLPYLYDANLKRCVLPEACSQICGPGEVYSHNCIGASCRATQCWERHRLPGCYFGTASACVRGCVCADGKLRTENGTCVPREQCPPESEERCRYPYSRPGCGNNCQQRCGVEPGSGSGSGSGPCDGDCLPGGCDCIPPFVYNENTKECVPRDSCPTNAVN